VKLENRIAIITGATSGIGEASALLFAEEGARVAVAGRDEARGRAVVDAITAAGGTAIFVRADVRAPADCQRIVAETLRALGGRLDILFNNAGVYHPHNAVDCTEEEWDATVDSSRGAWLMSKYSLPTMTAQGRA
jgi:NAD(P)-dependent dehydrogenase (short-subunit alcohol dehydrogenase family)